MEMVAVSKMRRAQDRSICGRPYSEKIRKVIGDLAALSQKDTWLHPLLQRRPEDRIAVVHITPDRGLCGGLPTNINRMTLNFILEQSAPVMLICVGHKGFDFMRRSNIDVYTEFTNLCDSPSLVDTLPVSRLIIDGYINGNIDLVYVAYTQFVSNMYQKPVLQQVLPVKLAAFSGGTGTGYIFEPSPAAVLNELLPRFVEMGIYHVVLESIASEQSARMVAMHSATENANELIQDLTRTHNKARQESVTKELLDIIGGAAAVA
jgi:F-type H+-transporting ATPase subunit gamma